MFALSFKSRNFLNLYFTIHFNSCGSNSDPNAKRTQSSISRMWPHQNWSNRTLKWVKRNNVRKIFENVRIFLKYSGNFVSVVKKCQRIDRCVKIWKNGCKNVRKFAWCKYTKNFGKNQEFWILKSSSKPACPVPQATKSSFSWKKLDILIQKKISDILTFFYPTFEY